MFRVLLFLVFSFTIAANAQHRDRTSFVKGVYGDPSAFLKNGMTFRALGINSIFVRSVSLDEELFGSARKEGVRVYVEFPTLNGEEYLQAHPEAWPIDQNGERASQADWFMGICLTDSGFKNYRQEQLKALLQQYAVDGIWLDYLHWHAQFETPEPILPETCFCDRCVKQFEVEKKVKVPADEPDAKAKWILSQSDSSWRKWRSEVLTRWVADLKSIVDEVRPGALLGIYYCPWYPEDFDGALYNILGLDLKALAEIVDVFSPMLYHHMMERPPEWVGQYVQSLEQTGITDGEKPRIWPIVQAHNKPGVVSIEEFRKVMWEGSRAPSTGVMMFTLHSLIDEPGKLQVMKDVFRKR